MGRLEKYGVCALLFVIVTVLAVSIWGPRPKKSVPTGGAVAKGAAVAPAPEVQAARPLGETATGPREAEKGGLPSPAPLVPAGPSDGNLFDKPGIPVPGSARGEEPAPPLAGKAVRYVVKHGETLDLIARRELGAVARRDEILKWNEGLDPRRLRAGQEIVLPPGRAVAPAATAAAAPPPTSSATGAEPLSTAGPSVAKAPPASGSGKARTHHVAKGETLYAIAQRYYGKGTRYREILEANHGVLRNERSLRAGMTLVIP